MPRSTDNNTDRIEKERMELHLLDPKVQGISFYPGLQSVLLVLSRQLPDETKK